MLSIDVGIKNLSIIAFGDPLPNSESLISVLKDAQGACVWKIIDITPDEYKDTCTFLTRQKKVCGKPSVVKDISTESAVVSFCGIHRKKMLQPASNEHIVEIDRNKISLDKVYTSLVQSLDTFLSEHKEIVPTISTIIIEKQPPKNPRMKAIMSVLQSYFVIRGKVDCLHGLCVRDIVLIDPKHKLSVYKGPTVDASHLKQKYDQRKFLAVQYVRHMIKNLPLETSHFEQAGPKRDDLADCFLQACFYYDRVHKKKWSVVQSNMRVFYKGIDLSKVRKTQILTNKRLEKAKTINLYTVKHLVETQAVKQENFQQHPLRKLIEKCCNKYLGGVNHIWDD
jgi:hypothetical protein